MLGITLKIRVANHLDLRLRYFLLLDLLYKALTFAQAKRISFDVDFRADCSRKRIPAPCQLVSRVLNLSAGFDVILLPEL